jgi:hypothetical protein
MTLTDNIASALDSAERIAEGKPYTYPGSLWPLDWYTLGSSVRSEPYSGHVCQTTQARAQHMAAWDPATALRHIAQARRLLRYADALAISGNDEDAAVVLDVLAEAWGVTA